MVRKQCRCPASKREGAHRLPQGYSAKGGLSPADVDAFEAESLTNPFGVVDVVARNIPDIDGEWAPGDRLTVEYESRLGSMPITTKDEGQIVYVRRARGGVMYRFQGERITAWLHQNWIHYEPYAARRARPCRCS